MKRRTFLGVFTLLSMVVFLLLCFPFKDYTLDDSFITYRYAWNVAHGHGFVWNTGEPPVEGFTSFLWVLINSGAIKLGMSPVVFSDILSVFSSLAVIAILIWCFPHFNKTLLMILISALIFNPAYAFLTMFGMETALTTLLLVICTLLAIRLTESFTSRSIIFWFFFAFLAALSRPDTLPYNGGCFLGLLGFFLTNKQYKQLKLFLVTAIVFAVLGTGYMFWRFNTFGHLFPNPFYIKVGGAGSLTHFRISQYFESFIRKILFPYLLFFAFLAGHCFQWNRLRKLMPVSIGLLFFFAYVLTIQHPIQGMLWRYIFPIFPSMLLMAKYIFSGFEIPMLHVRFPFRKAAFNVCLILFFIVWPLRLTPRATRVMKATTPYDRIVIGKRLSGLPGTMILTESGAIPYYSQWRCVDLLGLNSEKIAHKGLSLSVFEEYQPDLIMMFSEGRFGDPNNPDPVWSLPWIYLKRNDYVAIAAIHKYGEAFHYYFARRSSPLFNEIVEAVCKVDTLEYGDMQTLLSSTNIPLREE